MRRRPGLSFTVLVVLAVIALSAVGCAQPQGGVPADDVPVPSVRTQSADHVAAEAIIVPCRNASLGFGTTGRVKTLPLAEGDEVVAGQELARLETESLMERVRQAEADLEAAQAELASASAGPRPDEIASAEAAVSIASSEAANALIAIEVAAAEVSSAQAAVSQAEAGVGSYESAAQVATGELAAAQARLRTAQASLQRQLEGPTALEIEIAKKRVDLAGNRLWGYQGQRDALGGPAHNAADYEAARGQVAAAESEVQIATLELQQLEAGPKASDIAVSRAQVSEAETGVQIAQAREAQAKSEIKSAQARALDAEARLEIATAQLAQSKSAAEGAAARKTEAEAKRDLLMAGATPEDILLAKATVSKAEAALAAAENGLQEAVLLAPFAGTVAEILIQEGELVTGPVPVIRMADLSCLQIETTDLSQVDVTSVKPGQKAAITVDALENRELRGTVERVALIARDYRGDKAFTTIISLDSSPKDGLRWGMSAFVRIDVR